MRTVDRKGELASVNGQGVEAHTSVFAEHDLRVQLEANGASDERRGAVIAIVDIDRESIVVQRKARGSRDDVARIPPAPIVGFGGDRDLPDMVRLEFEGGPGYEAAM